MVTRADAAAPFTQYRLPANCPGAILKVISTDSKRIVAFDRLGIGEFSRENLIVLHDEDAKKQILEKIDRENQEFAMAQYVSLYNKAEAYALFEKAVKKHPNHDWLRVRFSHLLIQHNIQNYARKLLEGVSASSDARLVADVSLAWMESEEKLEAIVDHDSKMSLALEILARQQVGRTKHWVASNKKLASEEYRRTAELISKYHRRFPHRPEQIHLRIDLIRLANGIGVQLPEDVRQQILVDAMAYAEQNKFDPYFIADVVELQMMFGKFDEAFHTAFGAVTRYPRTGKTHYAMHGIAIGLQEHLKELCLKQPQNRINFLLYDWEAIQLGNLQTHHIDIPKLDGHSIPRRLIDGEGRRISGTRVHPETNESALELLCRTNNVAFLEFLDEFWEDVDYSDPFSKSTDSLIQTCIKHDSAEVLRHLIHTHKIPFDNFNDLPELVIKHNAFACLNVLINSGFRLTATGQTRLAAALDCKKNDVKSRLNEIVLNRSVDIAIRRLEPWFDDIREASQTKVLAIREIRDAARSKEPNSHPLPDVPVLLPANYINSASNPSERRQRIRHAMQVESQDFERMKQELVNDFPFSKKATARYSKATKALAYYEVMMARAKLISFARVTDTGFDDWIKALNTRLSKQCPEAAKLLNQ